MRCRRYQIGDTGDGGKKQILRCAQDDKFTVVVWTWAQESYAEKT